MEWKISFHKRSPKKHRYTEDEKKKIETMKKYIGSVPFPSNLNPPSEIIPEVLVIEE